MSPPTPTQTRQFTTTEPESAHDWLRATFAGYQPEETSSARGFRFRAAHTPVGRDSLAHLTYATTADNNVELSDVMLVLEPAGGRMRVRFGHDEEVIAPGDPVVFPPHQAVSALWVDTDAGCVALQAADVERVAVETTGIESSGLRFTGLRPMTAELGARWRRAVHSLMTSVLRDPRAAGNPVVTGQVVQRLAAAALDTFPSTKQDTHRRIPPDHATPAVVRRAEEFIDEHADRELTLSEIAAASGIGPRGLQSAFVRHQDTTPMAYAGRVRMERAHRDLQAAAPEADATLAVTVADIAARWGFADARGFAVAYERAYRQPPERTLRA